MDFKEHIKKLAERYGKNLIDICGNLSLTRNSLFVKLKNESVKISYLPELANAIGCTTIELIVAPEGFEHTYNKKGTYTGLQKK